jgi:amidase
MKVSVRLSIGSGIVAALLGLASSVHAQPALKIYKDPTYGVSFSYPANWNAHSSGSFYLGTVILDRPNGEQPDTATVVVGYAGTNTVRADHFGMLDGVAFTYLVLPHSTPEACLKRITEEVFEPHVETETIHGVTFSNVNTSDAGLGHGANRDLYAAYLNDNCYLFEAALHTINGASQKPSPQMDKLQDKLGDIIQTVRIQPTAQQSFHVEETTIADTHAALRAHKTTCVQIAQTYLARLQHYDQSTRLNTVVSYNPTVLADAARLDREFAQTHTLKPLQCIAFVVKDNYDTANLQTTGGSLAMKGVIPLTDAFMVARIRAAGALILFKSNMAEWAFSPVVTESSIAGITRNPYDLTRVPAGSSGGTAASVAANLAEVGLGTDTGDSIRGPASHNDLVGIRPTIGLTSRDGIVPLFLTADVGGPLARTVADAAAVLGVVAGFDPADPITKASDGKVEKDYTKFLDKNGLKGARIGVFRHYSDTPTTDPEIKALFEKSIADLKAQGAEIIDPFDLPEYAALTKGIGCGDFQADVNRYLAVHAQNAPYKSLQEIFDSGLYLPYIQDRIKHALAPDSATTCEDVYHDKKKIAFRDALTAAMDAAKLDAIIYPTWSNPPRKVGDLKSPGGDNNQILSPQTGFPAITVPMGFTHGTLPAGITFLGRSFTEPTLIRYAYAYEQTTHHRQPPIGFGPLPSAH